mmetsp:Transcript_34381/g.83155  ORF Transcript_34381/g.83155 Transcript_34381/m.83155 type:complete len:247 (-) Transcript_34381:701-1441(-)
MNPDSYGIMPTAKHFLHQITNICWHLVDLCAIKTLNILQCPHILRPHKVDRHALPAKPPAPPNPMNVQFFIWRQIVANDKTNLLHVNAPAPQIRGDEHSARPRAEFFHDPISFLLRHVPMYRRNREVRFLHLPGQPVDLLPRVAEDDRLGHRQRVVQVAERVKLPLLLLHGDVELSYPLERQVVALHEDAHGIVHKLSRHLQHLHGQRRAHEDRLRRGGEVPVDVVNLLLEPLVEHFVGLVDDERL